MPCEHMGVLLSRYVDGEASVEDRQVVEGHVRDCADCRKELEVFKRNEGLLAQALSGEVAGEAFIADVLARAGLAPARPGPIRRRLSRAAAGVAAFLAVPARAAAIVLLGLSGFFAYIAYDAHQENDKLIGHLEVALDRIRQGNDANRELVALVQQMKDAIEHAASRTLTTPPVEVAHQDPPKAPEDVVVETPVPVEQPEPKQEVKALLPTDFFHFVSATSSVKGVVLRWETKTPAGKVAYNVYRQDRPGETFHGPLNEKRIEGALEYLDETARPAWTYAYQIEAVPEAGASEKSRAIEIHTLGDIRVQNNGSATIGSETRALIDVQRYVDGKWLSANFRVAEGQPIGGRLYCEEVKAEVDFSTGYVLKRIAEEEREVRRLVWAAARDEQGNALRDPRTGSFYYVWREVTEKVTTNRIGVVDRTGAEYKLWKGEGRRGTLGSLE